MMKMKPLTPDEYRVALERMFVFVDRAIVPTLAGDRQADERLAAEIAKKGKRK